MKFLGKKKKPPAPQVTFADAQGRTLYSGDLYALPIGQDKIIEKSIEFYDDPEPCAIHRGAVYTRLCAEIEQFLSARAGDAPVCIDELPHPLRGYLDFGGETSANGSKP